MARRVPDKSKERCWRRLLQQWRHSGQSIRAFCRDQAVAEPSFYAWRRTLAERDQQPPTAAPQRPRGRPQASPTKQRQPTTLFAPVRLIDAAPVAPIDRGVAADAPFLEVLCRGGRIVRVAAGVDPAAVRALVAALEELPC
jgi:transposase-like protein